MKTAESRVMNICLCRSRKSGPVGPAIELVIRGVVSEEHFTVHFSIDAFGRFLRSSQARAVIAVLVAGDQEELDEYMKFREWLTDIRVILVLADESPATIRKAHRLQPRFLAHTDDDPAVVGLVLERMIGVAGGEGGQGTQTSLTNLQREEEHRMQVKTQIVDQAVGTAAAREGKYLTFSLAREEYGIGILKVKEIIGMMRITPVPQTPAFVQGVINLRGKVIPVINLRMRFGMELAEYDDRTCIIVVEINMNSGKIHMGIVVDSVSEVVNIKSSDIEDTPTFGGGLDTKYILGMAKTGGGVKILLDIDRVLTADEIELLEVA